MPHIVIEYAAHMAIEETLLEYLKALHGLLPSYDKGFHTEDCKGRILPFENFLMGSERESVGFVHMTLHILSGRSEELRVQIGTAALALLKAHLAPHFKPWERVGVTVDIREMQRTTYQKYLYRSE